MISKIQEVLSFKNHHNESDSYFQQFIELEKAFWTFENMIYIIPLGLVTLYRFLLRKKTKIIVDIKSKEIPAQKLDYLIYFFMRYNIVHYLAGLFEIFILWDLQAKDIGFIIHHLSSLMFLPSLTALNFYPWFQTHCFFWHSLVTVFPDNYFYQIAYFISLAILMAEIKAHPYSQLKRFMICEQYILALSTSLIFIFAQYYNVWDSIEGILFGFQEQSL